MNSPSLLVPLIMIWLAVGALTAWVAAQKRKPMLNWFLAGFLFGPVALLAVLLPSRINPALSAKWSYLILSFTVMNSWLLSQKILAGLDDVGRSEHTIDCTVRQCDAGPKRFAAKGKYCSRSLCNSA